MRPQWIPYPVEMGTANAKPFAPTGQLGSFDYLAAGRWWDRPDYAMGNCLRGFTANDRFATHGEPVIKRTSGAVKRRNRKAAEGAVR